MTDVRLTATNPEDSSVVPVACNAKGELLLEDAPAFDGTVDGDLTVSGSGQFAGAVNIGDWAGSAAGVASGPTGYVHVRKDGGSNAIGVWNGAGGSPTVSINPDGSASFAGDVTTKDLISDGSITCGLGSGIALEGFGAGVFYRTTSTGSQGVIVAKSNVYGQESDAAVISADGSATFSGDVECKNVGTVAKAVLGSGGGLYLVRVSADTNPAIVLNSGGSDQFVVQANGEVVVGSRGKQWMLVEQGGLCHMVEQTRATPVDGFTQYPPLRDVFAELNAIENALAEVMEKLRMTPPAGWEVWDGSSENS